MIFSRRGRILLLVVLTVVIHFASPVSAVDVEAEADMEYMPVPLPIALAMQTGVTMVGMADLMADFAANKADLKMRDDRYETYEDSAARWDEQRIDDVLPREEAALVSGALPRDIVADKDSADRASHTIAMQRNEGIRDEGVQTQLQAHAVENTERRAQTRLDKDEASVREFEGVTERRLYRERRESDLRLQNKLDESETVLGAWRQTLRQRLDEERARTKQRIENMQRAAELRVAQRQREAAEAQDAQYRALEKAERDGAVRLQSNVATSELRRRAARQSSEAQLLAQNAAAPGAETAKLAKAMRSALQLVRDAEAKSLQRLRAGAIAADTQRARLEGATNAVVARRLTTHPSALPTSQLVPLSERH